MSFFLGGGGTKVKPQYTGIQLQTSSSVLALTLAWGCNRFAPNLIWYADFKAHKQVQKTGGKGGGKVESYTYSASCIFALQDGGADGITGIGKVYKDSDKSSTMSALGMTLFPGTIPQSTWGYLSSKHPSQARSYPGVALIAVANYDLGTSAALPNHSFEVQALAYSTSKDGSNDADPAIIVDDFLMSPYFGAGMTDTNISMDTLLSGPDATTTGDAAFQTYCAVQGFGLSPVLSDPTAASDTLDRWMKICNTAIVWTGYTLKFIPYDLNEKTANGYHYLPVTAAIYTLTDKDFMSDAEDPISVTRTDPADANNSLKLTYSNAANDYNDAPVEYKDQGLIDQFGLRQANTFEAPEITRSDMATKVVDIMGIREAYFRNSYKFQVGPEYCLIEPMDLLIIVDPKLGTITVQVTDVTEDDDGNFAVAGDEVSASITSSQGFTPPATSAGGNNTGISGGPVNPPLIFDVPADLSNGIAQVWVAVSGGNGTTANPYWGGCLVWVSKDGVSYANIGNIDSPSRMGKTTDILPAYAGTNPDEVNTVGVNLAMSDGELVSVSAGDAADGTTLARIGAEFLSFENATLTSANNYDLDGLYRGLYRTAASAHANNSDFVRLDESVFKYDLPADYVGVPLSFKFQSYNIWNQALEDLADCEVYEYEPTGAGFDIDPPGSTNLAFVARQQADGTNIIEATVTVTPSDGPYLDHYDVQLAASPYTTWIDLPAISASGTKTTMQPALASTNYKARSRAVSSAVGGVPSAWIESAVVGSGSLATAAPSAPTSLVATGGVLSNTLTWDAGSGGGTPQGFKIYAIHGSSGGFGSATLIGTATGIDRFVHTGLSPSDTWRYWVTAYNFVGESSEAGPSNATTDSSGGGGGSVAVDYDGDEVVATATRLNFIGDGVQVTDQGSGVADIEILGFVPKTTPVIRDQDMGTYSGGTKNVPLPALAEVGDTCLIFYAGAWGGSPSGSGAGAGWTTYNQLTGSNWNGSMFMKTLTSTEVTAGVIPFNNGDGGDWGVWHSVALEGEYTRRNSTGERSGSGTGSDNLTITDLEVGDLIIYFGSNRANSTNTINRGDELNTLSSGSPNVSAVSAYEASPTGGSRTATFDYSSGGSGYYEAIMVFEGTSSGVSLEDLDNVSIPAPPPDGYVLTYETDTGLWIAAPGGSGDTSIVALEYTGSNVSIVVPQGKTGIKAKLWGGGGSGGQYSGGHWGGGGGYTEIEMDVAEGDELILQVAGGGTNDGGGGLGGWPDGGHGSYGDTNGGGGGGSSRLWLNSSLIAVAAGGGGSAGYGGDGGAGGGLIGQNSTSGSGGTGGTQSAGGYDSNDSGDTDKWGLSLIAVGMNSRTGGHGGDQGGGTGDDGGAGGGGYWGGGGGGGDGNSGGGGSGYVDSSVLSGETITGANQTPPKTTDPDYPGGGVAYGSTSNTSDPGGAGFIIVYFLGKSSTRLEDLLDVNATGIDDGQVLIWSELTRTWVPGDGGGGGGGGGVSVGALQFVKEVVLTADASDITFTGLPSSYADLVIVVEAQSPLQGASNVLFVQMNGDTGSNYDWYESNRFGPAGPTYATSAIRLGDIPPEATSGTAVACSVQTIELYNYASDVLQKHLVSQGILRYTVSSGYSQDLSDFEIAGDWRSLDPVDELKFYADAGDLKAGTKITIYGRGGVGGSGTAGVAPYLTAARTPVASEIAKIAATDNTNLPSGGAIDVVADKGGNVGIALYANTDLGFSGRTIGTTYTVPAGCVAVLVSGACDDQVRDNTTYYSHRLYNATQAKVCGSFVTAGSGNLSWESGSWVIGKNGIVTTSAGGGTINQTYPVIGVAGDVIQAEAWSANDGNDRIMCGEYHLLILDAVTGDMMPVYGGGGGGSGYKTPTLVQMATLRNDGTLALASPPTPGNLLVFAAGGYASSLGNYYPWPDFVRNAYWQSDGNNGVQFAHRVAKSGDTGSWALSASDNQFCAVYEFEDASTVLPQFGGYLPASGTAWTAAVGGPIIPNSVRILVTENDTSNNWSLTPAAGLTEDFNTTDGNNHKGLIVRIDADFDGNVEGTIASGFSAQCLGLITVVGKKE